MSDYNCEACAELKAEAAEFVLNGVTEDVCTSLKNDTGFSTTNGNDDCTDLNNANDCLIGRMDDELEAYDTCQWKEYMHKFVPNLYEVLKAMICAVCGLWTNVHNLWTNVNNLWSRINALCSLIQSAVQPTLGCYGIRWGSQDIAQECGTLDTMSGSTKWVDGYTDAVSSWFGLGFQKISSQDCSGKKVTYTLYNVRGLNVKFNGQPTKQTSLWHIDKATALAFGFPEKLWEHIMVYEQPIQFGTTHGTTSSIIISGYIGNMGEDNDLHIYFSGATGDITGKTLAFPSQDYLVYTEYA